MNLVIQHGGLIGNFFDSRTLRLMTAWELLHCSPFVSTVSQKTIKHWQLSTHGVPLQQALVLSLVRASQDCDVAGQAKSEYKEIIWGTIIHLLAGKTNRTVRIMTLYYSGWSVHPWIKNMREDSS